MINITFTPETILMICTDSDDGFWLPGPVPSVPSPFVVSVVYNLFPYFSCFLGVEGGGGRQGSVLACG